MFQTISRSFSSISPSFYFLSDRHHGKKKQAKQQPSAYQSKFNKRVYGGRTSTKPCGVCGCLGKRYGAEAGVRAVVRVELLMTTSKSFPPVIIHRCKMKSNLSYASAAPGARLLQGQNLSCNSASFPASRTPLLLFLQLYHFLSSTSLQFLGPVSFLLDAITFFFCHLHISLLVSAPSLSLSSLAIRVGRS